MTWRFLVLLLNAAQLCLAFEPDKGTAPETSLELSGVVLEVGTDQPLAGVEVKITPQGSSRIGESPPDIATTDDALVVVTDSDGRFKVTPPKYCTYGVSVQKEGWGPAASALQSPINLRLITITEEHRRRELQFRLSRPARVISRTLDASSRPPVRKGLIMAWHIAYREGARVWRAR